MCTENSPAGCLFTVVCALVTSLCALIVREAAEVNGAMDHMVRLFGMKPIGWLSLTRALSIS